MLSIPEEQLENFKGRIFKSEEATYPEDVSLRASYVTHIFKENLEEDLIDLQIFFEEICLLFIEDFIEGGDFTFTIESIAEAKTKAMVKTAIQDLKEEGLIDSVEDGSGEEIIFLTKEGQDYYNKNNEQHSKED